MKALLFITVIVHGLIHLLGFAKGSGLFEVSELTQPISKRAGFIWLTAALLFVLAALLYLLDVDAWWMVAMPAVVLSQTLIFLWWHDAKFGTIANVAILVPLVVAIANFLPGSYMNIFRVEAERGISRLQKMDMVSENDLAKLPEPLQRYLRYAGVVNKPRVQNFRANYTGQISRTQQNGWMDIAADQYNFYDEPTRVFFIRSSVFGIPMDGLHLYKGSDAVMQIRVASLYGIVDAKGDTMTKSETVTMFNDMCIMAPATLIDSSIHWKLIDSLKVLGTFTNQGHSVSATLFFNERGELVDFSSDDRFMSSDGVTYKNYRWSTPIRNYKDFDGRKVATQADLIWHTPEGDYIYGKFELTSIEYNCTKFKW
jgi:hypothetical protein